MTTALLITLTVIVGAVNLVVSGCLILASQSDEEINALCQQHVPKRQPRWFRF